MREQEKEQVKIFYGGDEMNITTLSSSLNSINELFKLANQHIPANKKIHLNITSPKQGSIFIDIILYASSIPGLLNFFTNTNIKYTTSLVSMVSGALNIRSHLKGFKPKKITSLENEDKVIIENNEGATINVTQNNYNFYDKKLTQKYISENFKKLSEDSQVESFTFKGTNESIKIGQDQFDEMATIEDPNIKKQTISKEGRFFITRPSFDEKLNWDLVFEGNKINAKVTSKDFYEKVNEGDYKFGAGDALIGKVEIEQVYREDAHAFINKKYFIVEVSDVISRDKNNPTSIF